MSLVIEFTVSGNPLPKERPRVVLRKGKARTYTPKRTKSWEQAIAWRAKEFFKEPLTGPVSLRLKFYRKDRRRTDGDNLTKCCLDSLNGIVYLDDSQVVDCHWSKHFDRNNPRIEIKIQES